MVHATTGGLRRSVKQLGAMITALRDAAQGAQHTGYYSRIWEIIPKSFHRLLYS